MRSTTPTPRPASIARCAASCLAVAGLFAALAWLGVSLAASAQRIAPVWLPNALLLGILLRDTAARTVPVALACFITNILVNLTLDVPPFHSVAFAVINIAETLAAAWAIRRLSGRAPDLADLGDLLRFSVVAGFGAPLLSGLFASGVVGWDGGGFRWQSWLGWSATDALGLLIGTPIVLAVLDAARDRRRPTAAQVGQGVCVLALGLGGAAIVFTQNHYPILFLVGPLVLVTAFRMSTLGVTLFVAGVTAIGTIATATGHGPIALIQADVTVKLLILQLFFATIFALGLPVGAVLKGLARTRADLARAHEFADSMLSNMREVIFRTDAEGRWVFLNPAWAELTGFSVAESLGWRTTRLLHPDDLAAVAICYPRIVSGEIAETLLEQRFRTRSGEWRDIEVSVRGLWDAGVFHGTIGNIRDVSERRRAVQALSESERRFQTLADLAPVSLFRADAAGQVTYVNHAFSDWTGIAPEAALGEGWIKALPEEDREAARISWRRLVAARASWSGDMRFLRPDGRPSWIHVTNAPILDEDGCLDGYVGIHLDIGERKAAEASLAEREAQLHLLAANATDAVFRLALDGTCRYASPSVGELLGVPPALLVGHSMLQRFHPDDEAAARAGFAALASGDVEREVLCYRSRPFHQNGDWIWLEANCGLVRGEAGAPAELIVSVRDITERRRLMTELEIARDAAEVASHAKASFLAHMSHELRTPMNGVLGFTELLLAGDLAPPQRKQVRMLAESGRAMMRLLNDILDLSKIEAGQLGVAAEPIDLRHAVRGCLQLSVPMATQKALDLDCSFDDAIPASILSDDLRIRQIVLNLLGNAVKFTAQGGVAVRARMVGPALLAIEVADTGIGIAPDRLAAVFEPFTQADLATARRYGGTGLGLSISRQLAELLGGTLSATSEPGRGSRFTLTVPAVAVVPEKLHPVPVPVAPFGRRPATGPRILLAEDHEINQLLTGTMLEGMGCRVTIARDGVEAVALVGGAGDDPFALVLMDVQMPNMDGLEAARHLRADGVTADTLPIVALTANAFADDVAACLRSGMQAHLAKPVQMAELCDAVTRWTATRPAARAA